MCPLREHGDFGLLFQLLQHWGRHSANPTLFFKLPPGSLIALILSKLTTQGKYYCRVQLQCQMGSLILPCASKTKMQNLGGNSRTTANTSENTGLKKIRGCLLFSNSENETHLQNKCFLAREWSQGSPRLSALPTWLLGFTAAQCNLFQWGCCPFCDSSTDLVPLVMLLPTNRWAC